MKCSWLLWMVCLHPGLFEKQSVHVNQVNVPWKFGCLKTAKWDLVRHTAAGFSTVPVILDKLGFSPQVRGPPACYFRTLCLLTGCQGACERDHFKALPPDPSLEFIARRPPLCLWRNPMLFYESALLFYLPWLSVFLFVYSPVEISLSWCHNPRWKGAIKLSSRQVCVTFHRNPIVVQLNQVCVYPGLHAGKSGLLLRIHNYSK